MKRVILLLCGMATAMSLNAETLSCRYRVTVAQPRKDCPVVVTEIPSWARSAVVLHEGREIASQTDVALGELAFVADIDRRATFNVEFSSEPASASYPKRVHAQMWWKNPDKTLRAADTLSSTKDDMYKKLHHHGPAFESEFAAYRVYFDKKQTIDTYGKKRPALELAETMWYPTDEQLAAGSGHDNLRVFGTIGVGVLKGWDAGEGKMVHITEFDRREARIIASGPVRTIVEMAVEGWSYCGRKIDMTSRYILYAGHSDVCVENRLRGDFKGLHFVTGVMKMAEHEVLHGDDWVAAWGEDFPENDTLKWERESVGLAVKVDRRQIAGKCEDDGSYLFLLSPDSDGHIDYSMEMLWRKSRWLDPYSDGEILRRMPADLHESRSRVVVRRLK